MLALVPENNARRARCCDPYTAVMTIKLPEVWLHPYGPILENLPLLVCIALLYRLEAR